MATVLIVEDDQSTVALLAELVGALGHQMLFATTGLDALALAADGRPDVILLDLGLPDLSGIDVITRLRSWTEAHILVVSGSRHVRRKADALDAGADDFVDKPFDISELRARLRLAERRRDVALQRPTQRRFGDVVVDYTHRRVRVTGREVRLTDIEWALMEGLSRDPGRLVTHRWLTTHVWGSHAGSEALVAMRTHMRTLRSKLGDDAREPRFIRTETGLGYRWVAAPTVAAVGASATLDVLGVLSRLDDVRRDLEELAHSVPTRSDNEALAAAVRLVEEAAQAVRDLTDSSTGRVDL